MVDKIKRASYPYDLCIGELIGSAALIGCSVGSGWVSAPGRIGRSGRATRSAASGQWQASQAGGPGQPFPAGTGQITGLAPHGRTDRGGTEVSVVKEKD